MSVKPFLGEGTKLEVLELWRNDFRGVLQLVQNTEPLLVERVCYGNSRELRIVR